MTRQRATCWRRTCARTSRRASAHSWRSANRTSPASSPCNCKRHPRITRFAPKCASSSTANLPADIRDRVLGFPARRTRGLRALAEDPACARLGCAGLAEGVRRHGLECTPAHDLRGRMLHGGAPRQMPFGLSMVGSGDHRLRHRRNRRRAICRKIMSMDEWWCQGYSEPGAGSDLASLSTRAERERRSLHRQWPEDLDELRALGDWIFCLVRTSTEGKPQQGISFLLIDMKTPGVKVKPIRTLDQGTTSTKCSSTTSRCRSRIASARRTRAGRLRSICSVTSAPTSPASACASACCDALKEYARTRNEARQAADRGCRAFAIASRGSRSNCCRTSGRSCA